MSLKNVQEQKNACLNVATSRQCKWTLKLRVSSAKTAQRAMHVPSSHKIKLMPVKKPQHHVKQSFQIQKCFFGSPRTMIWSKATAPRSREAMHGANTKCWAHPPTHHIKLWGGEVHIIQPSLKLKYWHENTKPTYLKIELLKQLSLKQTSIVEYRKSCSFRLFVSTLACFFVPRSNPAIKVHIRRALTQFAFTQKL